MKKLLASAAVLAILTSPAQAQLATINGVSGQTFQSSVTSSLMKTDTSGNLAAAIAGTDFQVPISVTTTGSGSATFSNNVLNIPVSSSGSGAISSVFGRTGAVAAAVNDYTFAMIGSKPTTVGGYGITDVLTQPLTGFTSGTGAVTATDTIISAIQKNAGNIAAITPASIGAIPTTSTIAAAGPIGSGASVPVLTYNATGQLTNTTTAAITPAAIGAAAATAGSSILYGNGSGGTSNATVASPLTFTGGALGLGTVPVANGGTSGSTAAAGATNLFGAGTTTLYNPQTPYFSMASGTSATGLLNIYNQQNDIAKLPNFRKCLSKVKSGAGRCRVLVIGDSTSYGYGSQGAGTDVRTLSWPAQLAKSLTTQYNVPVDYDSFMGNSNGQSVLGHDPRMSATSGWGTSSGNTTVGGSMLLASTANSVFSFKPIHNVDTCTVWTPQTTGLGILNAQIDSGTVTAINEVNATSAVVSTTLTTTPGQHTLNLTSNSAASVFIIGAECYDSTHPGISIINAGWYGSNTSTTSGYGWSVATNAWSPYTALPTVAGDLNILTLGLNDATGSIGLAAYKTNLTNLYNQLSGSGARDVVMATEGHENNGTGANDATITPYMQAFIQTATTLGSPLLDTYDRQVSGALATAEGWYYSDNVHYNAQGYADIAQGYSNFLGSVIGAGHGVGPAVTQYSAASDVNFINAYSSVTGASPTYAVGGPDANIGLNYTMKGAGELAVNTGYVTTPSVITYSANPALNAAQGLQTITLTGNVTSSTITGLAAGQDYTLQVCQDSTGGRTWAWPTAVHGGMTIGNAASTCSQQNFKSFNGATLVPTGVGVTNIAP